MKGLELCKELTHLNLARNRFESERCCALLGQALAVMNNLTSLTLENCNLSDTDITRLLSKASAGRKAFSSLSHLNLAQNMCMASWTGEFQNLMSSVVVLGLSGCCLYESAEVRDPVSSCRICNPACL